MDLVPVIFTYVNYRHKKMLHKMRHLYVLRLQWLIC